MGAANSNLNRCIEDEYKRLVKQSRDYLVVDEILAFKQPASSWSVDTAHLGVIFMLDRHDPIAYIRNTHSDKSKEWIAHKTR